MCKMPKRGGAHPMLEEPDPGVGVQLRSAAQRHDKLIAAGACGKIARLEQPAHAGGKLRQDRVACGVPEYVVDGIESIKIHKDETDGGHRAAGDDVGEVPLQSTTIHQPGKRIMQGSKPQPGFGSSERAHILDPATRALDGATHAKQHRATI